MNKSFRLFQDRDVRDWESRGEPYGPSTIEKIQNPDGDYSKKDPTSIPSPFARIDLVRSAFKYVTDKNDHNAETIYHRLVSDCLDLAELLFNIDKFGNIEIKSWDKDRDLELLLNSSNPKHQLLGETLNLFLQQDADSNNFQDLKKFYFVFYDTKIIGGTSPTTLFYTSANDLSFANINNGNDVFFDKKIIPLYKRDGEFQKYIYKLFYANPDFSQKMRDFGEYLNQSLSYLNNSNSDLYKQIRQIEEMTPSDLLSDLQNNYRPLDMGTDNNNIEVLGCRLYKRNLSNRESVIEEKSQFVIQSEKSESKPLVLQNNFSEPLVYTDSNVLWNSHWQVPYSDSTPINERTLPEQFDRYPYITVSDFLQPYLIRVDYPIDANKYFDGNIKFENGDKNKGYLLPLTPQFFDYFDTDDLTSNESGKPKIEMIVFPNSVEVYLKIPIKGDTNNKYITFSRIYENPIQKDDGSYESKAPDIKNNKGSVVESSLSVVVYPFLKITNDENLFYRIMFLDRDEQSKNLLYYKNKENSLVNTAKTIRSQKEKINIQTEFYIIEDNFDYIELQSMGTSGIIIPKFEKVSSNGSNDFAFAIDFGTTNTHIEYLIKDSKKPKAFDITKSDMQFATLFSPDNIKEASSNVQFMYQFIIHEFLPILISKEQSEFYFPIRTTLNENINIDLDNPSYALADLNIPFDYEKYPSKSNSKISTNLKWSNDPHNVRRIECFFEELLFLIRNKILLNNGNLKSTKLIWFYPSSMSSAKLDRIESIWNKLYREYISPEKAPIKISESIAPYYFYKGRRNIGAEDRPVVGIDIGGGTSDIVIYKGKDPVLLTSIRFASNTIFGDGYGGSPENNGFVIKYKELFQKLLNNNNLFDLEDTFNQIIDKGRSEDISTFLFSLEENKKIKENNIPISYNSLLKIDNQLKFIILIFYASIAYHLAKLMSIKELDLPRFITFSGTGSKILSIIDSSTDYNKLEKLTKLIFKKVYKDKFIDSKDLELKQSDNPKEITCKGGLLLDTKIDKVEDIKNVLLGDGDNILISEKDIRYSQISDNSSMLEGVVSEANNFIELLFELHKDFNFANNFDIDISKIDSYKEVIKKDLMRYLKSGIESKKDELNGNLEIKIEESLFFYPLIGALNNLAYKIVSESEK